MTKTWVQAGSENFVSVYLWVLEGSYLQGDDQPLWSCLHNSTAFSFCPQLLFLSLVSPATLASLLFFEHK
jgi:hypothetical protein